VIIQFTSHSKDPAGQHEVGQAIMKKQEDVHIEEAVDSESREAG